MATAKKLISAEKAFVRSKPYGDKNMFNNENGQPWCAYFQKYNFSKCGMGNWIDTCPNPAYCPNLESWAKKNGRWTLHGKAGDMVLFDWNSNKSPDHVGMVIKRNSNGSYTTVEGNTSNASNGNGGCVQVRVREARWILGFIRPPYTLDTTERKVDKKSKSTSSVKKYSGSFPSLAKHSDGRYLGMGDKGTEVKKLQKFLNWYLGYGLKVDGQFGAMTRRAVIEWQKTQKFTNTGLFGETSLARAKRVAK